MSRTHFLTSVGALLLLVIGLVACSAQSSPRQIATYPLSTPYFQPDTTMAYNIYLELQVPDLAAASDSAIQLAYQLGGMLVDSQSWRQDGYNHNTLVLAVPADHYAAFQQALLELGRPVQEQLSSRVMDWPGKGPGVYAYFTVYFQQEQKAPPPFPLSGWRPIRTLTRAWSISASILDFLVDIVIWMAVILGPFILIGVEVWAVIRSLRS